MTTTAFLILSFSSLFAVIDPLGVIPFYSGLTSEMSQRQKTKVLIKALVTSFFVLSIFVLTGQHLLHLFGITIDAFRIAGGIIFLGIGLDMLQSKPRRWRTGIKRAAAEDRELASQDDELEDDPSITPLAIPMIAGPGSITTVMVLAPQAPADFGLPLLVAIVVAILVLTGIILLGADAVLSRLGSTGLKVIEKLMGLLVTVIAVQLIIDGVSPIMRNLIS
ncbi:MAG: multiple antibiotic resistance protein [Candidatus Krumholzibacteriia bacterium]|jgi:multiple antibiotic resistance protein